MAKAYDAIVVGARCAGSPTAMLLARKGYRVLVVDRATFPSDTVSTHIVQPLGVAALARWGLLDRLVATGCPPIHTYSFDFGPFTIAGSPGTDDAPVAYCPRRTVLDKLLVDAAAEAGAEVREGFGVDELLTENGRVVGIAGHSKGGAKITERATVVIGADGRHSRVAEQLRPEQYNEKPPLLAAYYTYWSGRPDARPVRYLHPAEPRIRGRAYARRSDAYHRGMAVFRVRGEQEGHRRQLPRGHRARARIRRARARREARIAVRRHGRAELLPQALRRRLGARRRRRLQQGLHYGAGHRRRLP